MSNGSADTFDSKPWLVYDIIKLEDSIDSKNSTENCLAEL
jgi:hypothetical protein